MSEKDLEFFGDIKMKMASEGEGYYIADYASPSTFDNYPDTKKAFVQAQEALIAFRQLISRKIKENGGDPDDYEM